MKQVSKEDNSYLKYSIYERLTINIEYGQYEILLAIFWTGIKYLMLTFSHFFSKTLAKN